MKSYIIIIVVILVIMFVIYIKRNSIMSNVTPKLTKDISLGDLLVTEQPFPNIPNEQELGNLTLFAHNVVQPVINLIGEIGYHSGFRSEQVNKAVGGVDNSQHRLGFALDFHPLKVTLLAAYKMIAKSNIPYDQLIIEKNAAGNEWIHISYNPKGGRKQLLSANWDFSAKKMVYKPMTV